LINIGGHNASFSEDHQITVTRKYTGTKVVSSGASSLVNLSDLKVGGADFPYGTEFHVSVEGKYSGGSGDSTPYMWIQPNRGSNTSVTCTISNISMCAVGAQTGARGESRKAYVDLIVTPYVVRNDSEISTPNRKYRVEIPVPAGQESASAIQTIAMVDTSRTDIRKYLEEYATYKEKLESSTAKKAELATSITEKEAEIATLEEN
jgi:hypothetical protein